MVKQTIQIYCRLKPTKAKKSVYELDKGESSDLLLFSIPKDVADGFINNKKEEFKFKFVRIFDQEASQDDIFASVAEPVIDNVLSGYNGTIFAYGQTGSGKTFTITGGPEKYSDRGIIPRTLSYLFEQFEKKPEYTYTLHVSYLEIYNENGYDLLDPQHEGSKLEDLPKVILLEDEENNIHLKNLSVHQANNEEEALNLLFLGDTNRMIAETPMNQASTRSHCIFTIHVTARETGSATIKRAKLHLVDLAGSERISKTGVNGQLLTEAKYINLSLHYLEQVIVALAEKNRSHIPYRNSMMTSVLRDSLGGNCMTSMIATCSIERKNLEESISTCRFAQRVALIKNEALVNEELDPKLIILKLKNEVEELKNQLALATGNAYQTADLNETEITKLRKLVNEFLEDNDKEATLNLGADMKKINFCFKIIKDYYVELKTKSKQHQQQQQNQNTPRAATNSITIVDASHYDNKETKDLKEILKQRDNEINILVNMLKKEKKRVAELTANPGAIKETRVDTNATFSNNDNSSQLPMKASINNRIILKDMSLGRQEAFEIFKRDYSDNNMIEEQKLFLKKSYAEAKTLGENINESRSKINNLKTKTDQIHMRLAATDSLNDEKQNQELENLKQNMENEKAIYRENFERLKNMKSQIEHAQHMIERAQVKLQKDFENWWNEQCLLFEQKQQKSEFINQQYLNNNNNASNNMTILNNESFNTATNATNSLYNSRNSSGASLVPIANPSDNIHRTKVTQSVNKPYSNILNGEGKISLTGDKTVDADITAFVNARKRIINQMKPNDS